VELWGDLGDVVIAAMSAIEHGLEGLEGTKHWSFGRGIVRPRYMYLRSSLCTTHAAPTPNIDLSTLHCTITIGYKRIEKNTSR
jgi:hypothetical protein